MSVQLYDTVLKNTTSSGITISDLSGLYIPASGTRDITDLFPFQRLIYSLDLEALVISSGIVVNIEGYDLEPERAQTFLSHHDATHIQGIPIGDGRAHPRQDLTTVPGSLVVKYNKDTERIELAEVGHEFLVGLDEDDHTHYLLADGTREVSYLDLTVSESKPSWKEGRLFWDDDNKTVGMYNNQSDVTVQIGQEFFVRAINKTGTTIPNGSSVALIGSDSGWPKAQLSLAGPADIGDNHLHGIATHAIPNDEVGFITILGRVGGVDTSGFNVGDDLFMSTTISGALTNVEPLAPDPVVVIGQAVDSLVDGSILVKVEGPYSMEILSDVHVSDVSDRDVLVYNSANSVWEHTPFDATEMSYDNQTFYNDDPANTVSDYLDRIGHHIGDVEMSARHLPYEVLTYKAYNILTVQSGTGHITAADNYEIHHVTWPETDFPTATMSGTVWFYVNNTGTILTSPTEPDYYDNAVLGSVFITAGLSHAIGTIYNSGTYSHQFGSRVGGSFRSLGPWVSDDGLVVSTMPGEPMRIFCSSGVVRDVLVDHNLPEMSSDDAGYNFGDFICWYDNALGGSWNADFNWISHEDGAIPLRYNDTNTSGTYSLGVDAVFTNGSSLVTSTTNLTSTIEPYNFVTVQLTPPTNWIVYNTLVSGVSWTGSQTDIDLFYDWQGPTTTGTVWVSDGVKSIGNGCAKHLLLRTFDDQMHLIYGQELFEDHDAAALGALPSIPEAIASSSVQVAAIVVCSGTTSLEGNIFDIRPIPFARAASLHGGGSVAVAHGTLTGLLEDDHLQYSLVNGTRDYSDIVGYNSHPTFATDTDIVDKKYVDDKFPIAHGDLSGVTSDQHHPRSHAITSTVDHTANTWKVIYTDDSGDINELSLGESDSYLKSTGQTSAPVFQQIDFLDLADTPDSYAGYNNHIVHVNAEATGLEFSDLGEHNLLFGNDFVYIQDVTESSTSSTTFVEKLTLSRTVSEGVYRVGWYFEWDMSSEQALFFARVQMNEVDISNVAATAAAPGSSWTPSSGFYYEALASGTLQLDIDFRSEVNNKTAYIRNARLEFWRTE